MTPGHGVTDLAGLVEALVAPGSLSDDGPVTAWLGAHGWSRDEADPDGAVAWHGPPGTGTGTGTGPGVGAAVFVGARDAAGRVTGLGLVAEAATAARAEELVEELARLVAEVTGSAPQEVDDVSRCWSHHDRVVEVLLHRPTVLGGVEVPPAVQLGVSRVDRAA